jgi:hypothetical protein
MIKIKLLAEMSHLSLMHGLVTADVTFHGKLSAAIFGTNAIATKSNAANVLVLQ